MDKEQLQQQLADAKAKVEEKIAQLTVVAKDAAAEAKEEIQEQLANLQTLSADLGDRLKDLGGELSEEFEELKEKAITGFNSLKDRFKDWF